MNPCFHILSLPKNSSFIANEVEEHRTHNILHWHEENELIYFINCNGSIYVNNNEFPFEQGDIFFLGSNCIHKYQAIDNKSASVIVIQFSSACFGNHFISLPECQLFNKLLQNAKQGLQFLGTAKYTLQPLIQRLPIENGLDRLILLLQCLQIMSVTAEYASISEQSLLCSYPTKGKWIDLIFQFTQEWFQSHITLQQAASAVCMSVPSFCHYFRQYTHKTYIDYLNEVRINFACRQLRETNQSVAEIGYESGYNTIAHFHRQFHKLKGTTPLQFRRTHRSLSYTINLKAI